MSTDSEPATEPLSIGERPPFVARMVRRLSVPIIIGWLAVTVILSVAVPSLEMVEKDHAVAMDPTAAPSFEAMKRMGDLFGESGSNAVAMIVLESEQPLGDQAHGYYDEMVRQLKADSKHVQHVQDFWGDPLTQGAAQSVDGEGHVCAGDPHRQPGDLGDQIARGDASDRRWDTGAAGDQGVRHRTDGIRRGSGPRRQSDGGSGHLLEPHGDLRDVAARISIDNLRHSHARGGRHRIDRRQRGLSRYSALSASSGSPRLSSTFW